MKINGISIHSSYSPEKEAQKFLSRQGIAPGSYYFLIIGPGKGYLYKEIKNMFPGSIIVSLYLDKSIYSISDKMGYSWYYGSPTPLKLFLSEIIDDFALPIIRLIEWYPCIKAFPSNSKEVISGVQQFLIERNASIITTVNFGMRWLRNSFINFTNQSHFTYIDKIDKPVLIAASGPSLSYSLNLLMENRNRVFLIALPSSLHVLQHVNLKPDLIINTDPGFWNILHFMRYPYHDIPVAMPLTASFNKLQNPVFLINQNTYIEKILLQTLKIPSISLPSNGTVAGSALSLANKLTSFPVIFAGLDFSYDDIHEHVTPHTFDTLIETEQSRLSPLLSILYSRKIGNVLPGNIRQNRAFNTYAAWFNHSGFSNKLYRLNPSETELSSFKNIDNNDFIKIINSPSKSLSITGDKYKIYDKKELINAAADTIEFFINLLNETRRSVSGIKTIYDYYNFFNNNKIILELMELTSFQELLNGIIKVSSGKFFSKKEIELLFTKTERILRTFKYQ